MKPMNLLHDLIREVAANEIMPYFLRVQSARKEDGSVLSQADLAAQAKLIFQAAADYRRACVGRRNERRRATGVVGIARAIGLVGD